VTNAAAKARWWERSPTIRPTTKSAAVSPTTTSAIASRTTKSQMGRTDRGSATVELAVSLPALVLLLATGLAALAAVRTQVECVDAAREAARTVARGERPPSTMDGSITTIAIEEDLVRATVRVHYRPFGGGLPGFDITGTSVAALEAT
jgi:hypothetical protein